MIRRFGSLVLAAAMLVGSASIVGAEASPETEAKNAVLGFYEGVQKMDVNAVLEHSKSIAWDTRGEYEFHVKDICSGNPTELVQYSIQNFEKVSDLHYVATVQEEYEDNLSFPAYEMPVIYENGEWLVVDRGVTFISKDDLVTNNSAYVNSNSTSAIDDIIVGEDSEYIATVPQDTPDILVSISENGGDIPSGIEPFKDSIKWYDHTLTGSETRRISGSFQAPYNIFWFFQCIDFLK